MPFIKCPSCGKEIQSSSHECMYCRFDMANYERDRRIKIVVQDPNIMPLGSSKLTVFNNETGDLIAEVRLGDVFYITISEPTEILVTKTAWRSGKAILRAKPNATYKIILHTGFLSSKIIIKDITGNLSEAGTFGEHNDVGTQTANKTDTTKQVEAGELTNKNQGEWE